MFDRCDVPYIPIGANDGTMGPWGGRPSGNARAVGAIASTKEDIARLDVELDEKGIEAGVMGRSGGSGVLDAAKEDSEKEGREEAKEPCQ